MLNFLIFSQLSVSLSACHIIRFYSQSVLFPASMVNKITHLKLNAGIFIKYLGDIIPDSILNIKLKSDSGLVTSLKNVLSDLSTTYRGIVLFIYPIANTPGCTRQACDFRNNFDLIKKEGFLVYGLSSDSPESQVDRCLYLD